MHQRQSEKEDKRIEHTTRGPEPNVWQVLKPQRARPPATSGHAKRQASDQILSRSPSRHFKNILRFRHFRSPIFPRWDKNEQRNIYFCPVFDMFRLEMCHDEGRKEDSGRQPDSGASGRQGRQGQMKAQRTKGSQDIWKACKKGHPPYLGSGKSL